MPSSLIIVALAAAWLVVLVPMVARKRQEVAHTNDSALAARVVRAGGTRGAFATPAGGREGFAMSEMTQPGLNTPVERGDDLDAGGYDARDAIDPAGLDNDFDDGFDDDLDDLESVDEDLVDEEPMAPEEQHNRGRGSALPGPGARPGGRYRPGRGGFDPEAAEIAAKAKYTRRQRVVVALIALVVITAIVAGFLWTPLWWGNGAAGLALVGYLVYLRRQVRIEEEIRQRRMARMGALSGAARARREPEDAGAYEPLEEIEVAEYPREIVGAERKPVPTSRIRRQAVVVDLDDEDPAFHELNDPGQLPFRRAAGE